MKNRERILIRQWHAGTNPGRVARVNKKLQVAIVLLLLLVILAFKPVTAAKIPRSGDDNTSGGIAMATGDSTNYKEFKNNNSEMNGTGVTMEFWVFYKHSRHTSSVTRIPPEKFNETTIVNVLVYRNATRVPENLVVNVTLFTYHSEVFGPFEPGRYLFVARNNISTIERTYHLVFGVNVRVLMHFDMTIAGFFLDKRNDLITDTAVTNFYGMLAHDEKMEDVQATSFSLEFYTSKERTPETLWSEVNVTEFGVYTYLPSGMNHVVVRRGIEKHDLELNTSEYVAVALYFSPENDSLLNVRLFSSKEVDENDPYPSQHVFYLIYHNDTGNGYLDAPPRDEKGTVIYITLYRIINGTTLTEHPFRKFNLTWVDEYYAKPWMISGEYLIEVTLNDTLHASRILNATGFYSSWVIARDVNATWLEIWEILLLYDAPPNNETPNPLGWPLIAAGGGLLAAVIVALVVLVAWRRPPKKPN